MAIDAFTKDARESGEFNDQLIGLEAKIGFRLMSLLGRSYDVAVANPPYMGSKNMGKTLKRQVEVAYPSGKRDLYTSFILRCVELVCEQGRVAMVTQQSWMFLASYSELRAGTSDETTKQQLSGSTTGLVRGATIESLAHLGRYAFSEITNAAVAPVLFVLSKRSFSEEHRVWACRLNAPRSSDVQAALLSRATTDSDCNYVFQQRQINFLNVPSCPMCYWLSERLVSLFAEKQLREVATVRAGLCTGHDARFIRFHWEVFSKDSERPRWVQFAKGGGYKKWKGFEYWVVDWELNGRRLHAANLPGTRVQNDDWYLKGGWSYSLICTGSMAVRQLNAMSIASHKGPFIHPCDLSIGALLNTRIASFLLRSVTPNMGFEVATVAGFPIPSNLESKRKELECIAQRCIKYKTRIIERELTERLFSPVRPRDVLSSLADEACLLANEAIAEEVAAELFQPNQTDITAIAVETGVSAGQFPLIGSFSHIPSDLSSDSKDWLRHQIENTETVEFDESIRERLQVVFESGEASCDSGTERDGAESDFEPDTEGSAVPSELYLESLCLELKSHPISILNLLRDGIENRGWISANEQRRTFSDACSVYALRHLGHCWPEQLERMEPTPEWADDDGIIPFTEVVKETKLQERVSDRFRTDEVDVRTFADVMGKSLEDWLTTEFFKHHTRQFKKRPIAWQLQSSSFTSRKMPTFACLVYYHRVDVDAIQKIRTQYTGPLKLRFETEMRGISSTPVANRTDNQAKRAVELEEAITELQAFDEKLATIAKSGFGPAKLLPTLRQYAFDDAMLAMKARWLKRLSELLDQSPGEEAADGMREASPLDQWQGQAIETGLHPELAQWIGEALSNLDYFCCHVGPKAPEAKKTPDDPSAADFAELIRSEIVTMQYRSIELACGVWWGKFDAAVLAPIKERIKTLKAEQKELNAAIKEDRQPVLDADTSATVPTGDTPLLSNDEPSEQTTELTKAAMKARLKEVKAKIKKFIDEMNLKAGKAQAIRDAIQAWNSSEPGEWHDWLAEGPMFDQVACLDNRRAPPKTIADFIDQESLYAPDINDGVRVNIAPLQKAGVLAADVLAAKDIDKAIADRAEWRADERRWVREGKLPQCGWWPEQNAEGGGMKDE